MCTRHITIRRNQENVIVPCGQCIECRQKKTREWAIRLEHEAKYWKNKIFVTLTYDNNHIPENNSLSKKDLKRFIRRLRVAVKTPIKYYGAGEYGPSTLRPHYHLIIFGWKPDDGIKYSETEKGPILLSKKLTEIWGKGMCTFANAEFDSMQYVAKYIQKKQNNTNKYFIKIDEETGEIIEKEKEFAIMTKSLGLKYLEENYKDIVNSAKVRANEKNLTVPRYYKKKILEENYKDLIKLKTKESEKETYMKNLEKRRKEHLREIIQESREKLYPKKETI